MQTKTQWSSNTYMPFLRAADESHLDRDSAGQRLVYGDKHIICENGSYVIRANESDEIIETIPIQQDSDGIDTEDPADQQRAERTSGSRLSGSVVQ